MNSRVVLLLFCLAAATQSFGQTPTPSPTPADDNVVKISTNLIQIDVSVTDAKGKPITDLKPSEIEIYENGQKQDIANFLFVSSGSQILSGRPSNESVPVTPPSTNASSIRRTIALVVDDISLSWESIHFTRLALKKFVDQQMQDGDLVAIIRTAGGIGVLQQFTTDKRILNAAIDKIKYYPMGTGGIAAIEPIKQNAGETSGGALRASQNEEIDNFLIASESYRTAQISTGTLGSLHHIVTGMKDLPGRKSAIIFSDGFVLFETDRDGARRSGAVMQHVQRVVDAANRASVIFYGIDPRGMQIGLLTAADDTTRMSTQQVNAALQAKRTQMWESQNGLNLISKETGGFAILNNNDLSGGVNRVLDDQSYYLISYVPDSETFNASNKYNKLEVKALRKDAVVRYRSGFFGVTDQRQITAPTSNKSLSNVERLNEAIKSPFAVNGINLRINSLFGGNVDGTSYVRSLLHIDGRDLTFTTEADGSKTCSFEVLAASFGENGKLNDQIGKTYTMTIPSDVYQRVETEGIVYHFKFPVKSPGPYQYRVAILDTKGKKIGAASQFVQVPDLKNDRLTLSSIVLENMSLDEYQRAVVPGSGVKTDPMNDTAKRRIQVGRVYRYSLEIYNPSLDEAKQPKLETQIRVFREGKLILDGSPRPFVRTGQAGPTNLSTVGGLAIGSQMEPGDYVLQIIVRDGLAKKGQQVATQYVQFEVVN